MREAVIVSTARTPIGKAYRGAFNDTQAQALIGHAVKHAAARAGLEGAEVEDVIVGAALQQGSTGTNIGRQAAIRAGFPDTVPGMALGLATGAVAYVEQYLWVLLGLALLAVAALLLGTQLTHRRAT